MRRVGHQHGEIGGRAAQHFVETLVGCLDRGLLPGRLAQFAARGNEAGQERPRPRVGAVAVHRQEQRPHLAGFEMQLVDRGAGGQPVRRRIEGQRRPADLVVQAAIVQQRLVGAAQIGRRRAAVFAVRAAHLEQVGKIVLEQDRDLQVDRAVAVIAHAKPLIGGAAPQEHGAQNVHGVLLQHDALVGHEVRIAQVDREGGIVVAQIGAEEQRVRGVDQQFQPRQIAGVEMEQAGRAAARRRDVAAAVEHDEGVAVFENARRPGRRLLRGGDVERRFRRLLHGNQVCGGFGRHCVSLKLLKSSRSGRRRRNDEVSDRGLVRRH